METDDSSKLEDFYKIILTETNSYNYFLNSKDLNNLKYNQFFIKGLKGVVLIPAIPNDDASVNKILLEKYNPDLVYTHPGRGGAFGDSLGWASFVNRLSEASGKCIKVTRLNSKVINLTKSILKTTGTCINVNEPVTSILPRGAKGGYRELYSTLFLPAQVTWKGNINKVVGVQFGKRGMGDRRLQDPEDEKRIIQALENKGYQVKQIGGELGDVGCMRVAAECQFFVGTCSGMSHLCHSVGTPVHMITNLRSLERVSVGHVKNSRSPFPTIFWQHPHHFIEFLNYRG